MEAISLDRIDTIVAWKVDTKRPMMNSAPDWLQEAAQKEVEGESVVEEDVPEKTPYMR
jgi:hypothetical protein